MGYQFDFVTGASHIDAECPSATAIRRYSQRVDKPTAAPKYDLDVLFIIHSCFLDIAHDHDQDTYLSMIVAHLMLYSSPFSFIALYFIFLSPAYTCATLFR
jgi:hypothetical protein